MFVIIKGILKAKKILYMSFPSKKYFFFYEEAKMKLYINNQSFVPSGQGMLEGNDHNYTRVQTEVTETKNS